ncbi:MAG: ABC transporter permease [Deltaproteobacteria bacterium]|nr:ABC transporter permease [Deltaproteobacteria bacterium]
MLLSNFNVQVTQQVVLDTTESMEVAHQWIRLRGRRLLSLVSMVGGLFLLIYKVIHRLIKRRIDLGEFWRACLGFGEQSIPIMMMASAFTGMILVLQGAVYVEKYGMRSFVGWYVSLATVKEVGPILIALMFSGRVGAKNTSELASMKVGEQMDALRVLALDVYELLIVPRVVAMVLAMACLVVLGDFMALVAAAGVADVLLGIDYLTFYSSMVSKLQVSDVLLGVAKTVCFGGLIAVVSSYCGLNAERGAQGVGRAVNQQVVGSAVAIFLVDCMIALGGRLL